VLRLRARIDAAWTEDFKRELGYGKYSKWASHLPCPADVVLPLAFAVRVLFLAAPDAYRTLDGAAARTYHPGHSMCAHQGGGWNMQVWGAAGPERMPRDAFLAFVIMRDVLSERRNIHQRDGLMGTLDAATTWWGVDPSAEEGDAGDLRRRLFDFDAYAAVLEFLLEDTTRLRGLLWDVQGIVCRGADSCAASSFDEISMTHRFRGDMHQRQIPPIFNIVKLGEHVDSLQK
jgi:hypothetical protein